MNPPSARLPRLVWIVALLLLLAYLIADSAARWTDVDRTTRSRAAEAPVPALDPSSPTGYAHGQHRLILASYSADGYQWLMQATQVVNGQTLRIRSVDWDNAPFGREAHWCSGLVWWVAGLAWLDHVLTGRSLPLALEHIAPVSLALLLALVLIVVTPVLARRFGGLVAIIFAAGLVFFLPLYSTFSVGYLDHHGPVAVCALLSVLFLAGGGAGWLRNPTSREAPLESGASAMANWLPERRQAARWFVASGFLGAAGLWISTASQVPVLVGIGLGVLGGNFLWGRRIGSDRPWKSDPTLWRIWGIAGAIGSMAFYLLEYFPSHWSWRLEVNHPLYALAWLGAGDMLCRLHTIPIDRAGRRRALVSALPAAAAVAALPLVVILAKNRVFILSDPFLWALHVDYIGEFQPIIARLTQHSWQSLLVFISHPLAGLLATGLLLRSSRVAAPAKALLALAAGPAAITTLMAFKQERWLGLACALAIPALALAAFVVQQGPARGWSRVRILLAGGALALVMVIHPLYWPPTFLQPRIGAPPGNDIFLTVRSLSDRLRQRVGADPVVIAGGFSITSQMIYFGGFRGIGTGYWENRDGLHATVEILGADTDAEALALIRKRGVTHIADVSWDYYSTPAYRLLHGLRRDDPDIRTGFLGRLENGDLPSWVRPVIAEIGQLNAMIYEIDLDQSPQAALVHAARFFSEYGALLRAESCVRKALRLDATNVPALITQANLQAARKQNAALEETMRHLETLLPASPPLDSEDELELARAWLAIGREPEARAALAKAARSLDTRRLRRLSPSQLLFLVERSRAWDLPSSPGVPAGFARSLLPKVMRPN
ncbi:MAG TPA: hypothetical protein VIM61_05645 [Chthoniobacterales bacterium]